MKYYNGKVTWSLPIQIPADAAPGMKPIEGLIAYQACTDNSCHKPMALKFVANVLIGEPSANSQANSQAGIITLASSKFATAMDAAGETPWVDKGVQVQDVSTAPAKSPTKSIAQTMDSTRDSTAPVVAPLKPVTASTGSTSYPVVLVLALLGGFVLNFMPCVLPVIGLKVMSFVSQGGQDRKRILSLNLAYVGGIFARLCLAGCLGDRIQFQLGPAVPVLPRSPGGDGRTVCVRVELFQCLGDPRSLGWRRVRRRRNCKPRRLWRCVQQGDLHDFAGHPLQRVPCWAACLEPRSGWLPPRQRWCLRCWHWECRSLTC